MLTRPLRLLFNTEPAEGAGGDPQAPEPTPPTPTVTESFPANTHVNDMTPEQQAAYWKFHSRKHEKAATERATELDSLRQAALTEDEKKLEEARRQGETRGANKFLAEAVAGQLRALTGKTDEAVSDALSFVDVTKFLAADGSLDKDKVSTFSKSLGTAAPASPAAPVSAQAQAAALLGRTDPNQRTGGSINARRKELRDQYRGN